jgi:hypothetical protein
MAWGIMALTPCVPHVLAINLNEVKRPSFPVHLARRLFYLSTAIEDWRKRPDGERGEVRAAATCDSPAHPRQGGEEPYQEGVARSFTAVLTSSGRLLAWSFCLSCELTLTTVL